MSNCRGWGQPLEDESAIEWQSEDRPVEVPERRAETVARRILHYVSSHRLAAGTRLPSESAMIAEFKVARCTIREALRILEFNGLIKIRLGTAGGPETAQAEPRELGRVITLYLQAAGVLYENLIQARGELEAIMARLAAASNDQGLMAEIAGILRRTQDAQTIEEGLTESLLFHRCISRAPGNRVIGIMTSALQEIGIYRLESHPPQESQQQIPQDHLEIGRAILERRPADAERLMREHFRREPDYGSFPGLRRRIEWI